MKLICRFGTAILTGLLMWSVVNAQDDQSAVVQDEELVTARAMLQAGREDIIRDEIRFTEMEATAFWAAYKIYLDDLKVVRDRQAELIATYLAAYRAGTVSEDLAKSLIDDYLDIKMDVLRVQRKHLKPIRKALPPRKAARFYQLENKLDAELDVQLARFIPLMDPV